MALSIDVIDVTEHFVSQNALFKVFRCIWAKMRGLDHKVLDHISFMLYFEEIEDLEMVLQRALWNFNNILLVVRKASIGMTPFQLNGCSQGLKFMEAVWTLHIVYYFFFVSDVFIGLRCLYFVDWFSFCFVLVF